MKYRRIIALILSLLLISGYANFLPANAAENTCLPEKNNATENTSQLFPYLAEAIFLEMEHPESPFWEIEESQLGFGNPLYTYIYKNDALIQTDSVYIPIFCGEVLFMFGHLIYNDNIFVGVELTDDLVEEMQEYVNTELCLVFFSSDAYIYSENNLELIKSYENEISPLQIQTENEPVNRSNTNNSHQSVETIVEENQLYTSLLSTSTDVCTYTTRYQQLSTQPSISSYGAIRAGNAVPSSYSLGATIIQQNGLPICWAAAVASIGLEITGISRTAEQISDYIYGENKGGNTYVALIALMGVYGLSGIDVYYAPPFDQIKSEVYSNGHPIYCRVYGADTPGVLNHAIFIDGYTVLSNSAYMGRLTVGDPNFTNYKYIYFVYNETYPYTLNGITGYVDQYVLLY